MEKDLMRPRKNPDPPRSQAGFSMVEMLMTAFILAIGILGLSMLQVMSMKASRGSRSLTTAVQVAEQVMDRVELEGRLSWLNVSNSQMSSPSNADFATLQYIGNADNVTVTRYFNIKGNETIATTADPVDAATFFTVKVSQSAITRVTTGQLSDVTVQVNFVDVMDKTSVAISRYVVITRRILHG